MNKPSGGRDAARAMTLAVELRVQLAKLKRRLREQADAGDLTSSQVAVLGRLERDGPATITYLARAEGMRPQSMGANIATLEAANLVGGAPDPADGRQTLWSITEHCRQWRTAGRAAREDWLSRAIQSQLSAAEQGELAQAVALLKRLADA